jgi:hypothetical protein
MARLKYGSVIWCQGGHLAFVVLDLTSGPPHLRAARHYLHEMGEPCPWSGRVLAMIAGIREVP